MITFSSPFGESLVANYLISTGCLMSLLFSQALLAGLTGSLSEEAIEERLAPTGRILVDGAVKPKVKTVDKNSPAHFVL